MMDNTIYNNSMNSNMNSNMNQGQKLLELIGKYVPVKVVEWSTIPQRDGNEIVLQKVLIDGNITVTVISDATGLTTNGITEAVIV